jgi:hypothetical protein
MRPYHVLMRSHHYDVTSKGGQHAMADNAADSTSAPTTDTKSDDNEPLGSGGMKALESERKARRDAEQRARAAEERVSAMEAEAMRSEIAASKGIPADLLTGSTKDELEASAAKLAEFRGDSKPGTRMGRPKEKLHGGSSNPYDDDEPSMAKVAESILNRRGP